MTETIDDDLFEEAADADKELQQELNAAHAELATGTTKGNRMSDHEITSIVLPRDATVITPTEIPAYIYEYVNGRDVVVRPGRRRGGAGPVGAGTRDGAPHRRAPGRHGGEPVGAARPMGAATRRG